MTSRTVHIFGSCVSRDALEFASGVTVGKYCARQSVVAAVSPLPEESLRQALEIAPGTHDFHRRCVVEDFEKTTLALLAERPVEEPVVIDFIEERVALGVLRDGSVVTFSQAATAYSNARSLVARLVRPYSAEYVQMFESAIGPFAERLGARPVVLHRALYAEGDWNWEEANRVLEHFYSLAERHLAQAAVIEVPASLRVSSPGHKWGVAPYHYVDGYYRGFVEQWSQALGDGLAAKPSFTLQKAG